MSEADAPNYKPSSPGKNCAACTYFIDRHCGLYDFEATPGYTCDSWTSEGVHASSRSAVMKKSASFFHPLRGPSKSKLRRWKAMSNEERKAHVDKRVGFIPPMTYAQDSKVATMNKHSFVKDAGFNPISWALKRVRGTQAVESASQKATRILKNADPNNLLGTAKKSARYGTKTLHGGGNPQAAPAVQLERFKMEMGKTKSAMRFRRSSLRDGANHTQSWSDTRNRYVEKTAMSRLSSIATGAGLAGAGIGAAGVAGAGLAGAGIGGLAGGAGGYVLGHKSGMKRDAETPYANKHMRYAYGKGRHLGRRDVIMALRRRAMKRQQSQGTTKKAFIAGTAAGGLSGYVAAHKKKKAQGTLAGLAGGSVGGIAGSVVGGLAGLGASIPTLGLIAPVAVPLGSLGGSVAGGALGGYLASKLIAGQKKKRRGKTKKAFALSSDVIEAAAYVQSMRKSAHVNLGIPDYIRGY